jgi:hypothetical protein
MKSRWSYIACGLAALGTLVGALVHSAFAMIVNAGLTWWNWHMGELYRAIEEQQLIEKYEEQKKENQNSEE